MRDARNRLGRLAGTMLEGARVARDRARALRDEFRTCDEPERALVAPLLPGQRVRYVGLAPLRLPEGGRAAEAVDVMADTLAESLDPRMLFGLLNIVNPVAWVDAVLAPVRLVAGTLLLPARAAGAAAVAGVAETTGSGAARPDVALAGPDVALAGPDAGPVGPDAGPRADPPRVPIPLTSEQEAFRAAFRLDRYRPLADQLAGIAHRRRHAFSGDLASLAGSLVLFLERYTGTPLAVTDTHLYLLRMGRRPDPGRPDHRRPQLLCGVPRSRITRIDAGTAPALGWPLTIGFDDGSWLRVVQHALPDDRERFLAAVDGIPGDRPGRGR